MEPIIYKVDLSVYSNEIKRLEGQKQGDSRSRYVEARLIDRNGMIIQLDTSMSATARMKKPDNKVSLPSCVVTPTNNTLTFEITQQALAVAGVVRGEVTLFDGSGTRILSSQIFEFDVDAVAGVDIVSENELGVLTEVIAQSIDAQAQLDEKINESEIATSAANTAADKANTSASEASGSASAANNATSKANAAALAATTAASTANNAASAANTAAGEANTAATAANEAAANVNSLLEGATATQLQNGLMSAGDKAKLDGMKSELDKKADKIAIGDPETAPTVVDKSTVWHAIEETAQNINLLQENMSLQGKILCFTASVTRPALTHSPSTNFYFCTLSIPLPDGYTALKGAYGKGEFLAQPIDSGLWLCHPTGVSSDGKTLVANLGTGANISTAGTIVVRVHVRIQ